MQNKNTDVNSLAYTEWNCKYHKDLHQNIEEKRSEVREIIRQLCQ